MSNMVRDAFPYYSIQKHDAAFAVIWRPLLLFRFIWLSSTMKLLLSHSILTTSYKSHLLRRFTTGRSTGPRPQQSTTTPPHHQQQQYHLELLWMLFRAAAAPPPSVSANVYYVVLFLHAFNPRSQQNARDQSLVG